MGVEGAVVGQHLRPQPGDPPLIVRRQFAGHAVVARESRGGQIVDSALHPLHRTTEHDRTDDGADVAGIGAHLAAEAAADIG